MLVVAKLKYLRISSRKVRLIADLIRGKKIEEAQNILNFTVKKTAEPLSKLLKQAVASAKNNFQIDESNLYIAKILVDEGPKYKRWRARSRGRANEIQKKTSHIAISLEEIVKPGAKKTLARGKKPKKVDKISPEVEKPQKESKLPTGHAKFRPEIEVKKLKAETGKAGGIKKIFRRKAF